MSLNVLPTRSYTYPTNIYKILQHHVRNQISVMFAWWGTIHHSPFRRESGTYLRIQSFLGKQDEREFFRTTVTYSHRDKLMKNLFKQRIQHFLTCCSQFARKKDLQWKSLHLQFTKRTTTKTGFPNVQICCSLLNYFGLWQIHSETYMDRGIEFPELQQQSQWLHQQSQQQM